MPPPPRAHTHSLCCAPAVSFSVVWVGEWDLTLASQRPSESMKGRGRGWDGAHRETPSWGIEARINEIGWVQKDRTANRIE